MEEIDCSEDEHIGTWLQFIRTYHHLQRRIQAELGPAKLTLPQLEVLSLIGKHQGSTQQELAEQLLVTRGNVCQLIDRLTNFGLVERRDDIEDRRINRLFLTDQGACTFNDLIPRHKAVLAHIMADLGIEREQTLRELLFQLETALAP